jgi:hypothetical protein
MTRYADGDDRIHAAIRDDEDGDFAKATMEVQLGAIAHSELFQVACNQLRDRLEGEERRGSRSVHDPYIA